MALASTATMKGGLGFETQESSNPARHKATKGNTVLNGSSVATGIVLLSSSWRNVPIRTSGRVPGLLKWITITCASRFVVTFKIGLTRKVPEADETSLLQLNALVPHGAAGQIRFTGTNARAQRLDHPLRPGIDTVNI